MRKRNLMLGAILFAILIFLPGMGLAQTGQITGRISTENGAAVPGASLTITQTSTGIKHIVESNQVGYYVVPALMPGPYAITAHAPGYESMTRASLELHVEESLQVDFMLQIGTVTQTVTVTAESPLLQTETSSLGQVISGRDVVDLPLLGRDAYALGELVPGVRNTIGMNNLPVDVVSTSFISINGAQATANDFLLDGAPNSASSYNQPVIYPIADSVQEFRVQTNNYSAEFGRSAGGIYDVVTKAGTNDLHYTAYEFYRNGSLTANNWFAKAAGQSGPPQTFNQFGGVIGGPVVIPKVYNGHNKTFFFVGNEYVRYNEGVTFTGTVPNPTELTGNFGQDVNSAGQPITIYDPFTTTASGNGYTRQAFSQNVIPQKELNPIAVKMASYFPKPNISTLAGSNADNYVLATKGLIHENGFTARVDQVFNSETSMFARYSYNNTPDIRPNPYGPGDVGGSAYGPQVFDRHNAVVDVDHVFSPTLLATIRTSFARLTNVREPASLGFDISTLGFPAQLANQIGPPAAFPVITIAGYGTSGSVSNETEGYALGQTGEIRGFMNTFALQGSITKTMGRHEFKMGTDLRLIQGNILQSADNSTSFGYGAAFTQGPNPNQASATTGDALASFLLGTPVSASVNPSPALALQTKYSAVYLQDDWKVQNTLTLNLGFRYEYETPFTERFNRLSDFDPNAAVPLTGVPGLQGALTFVGVNGESRYSSDAYADHFEPRFGFAWHMFPKTVLHGGGGFFYDTLWGCCGESSSGYGISGFTTATSMVTSLNGVTPYNTMSNPYPGGLNAATGSSLGAATLLGQTISATQRDLKTPYTEQWNLGIQEQLAKNLSLDLTYVGTHSLHDPSSMTLDELPDSDLTLGNALNTLVANPFYGQIATGSLSTPEVSEAQLLRPFPQFTGITTLHNWPQSSYNAMEAMLEKRYSSGFSMQIEYTWSKMMDQGSGYIAGESLGGGSTQDWNNLKAERSISSLDQTNRVVGDVIYAFPFYRNEYGIMGHVLGGWTISALPSFISGDPLGISSATNGTDSQGGGRRPNWNGQDAALAHHTIAKWFNTSYFSTPPAFQFGNTPRNFGNLRSDWIRNIDVSLHKDERLHDKLHLQLRVDAFNMDNTPTFAPPNTSYGSATFGVVSSQQNQPRSIQLGLKISY